MSSGPRESFHTQSPERTTDQFVFFYKLKFLHGTGTIFEPNFPLPDLGVGPLAKRAAPAYNKRYFL